MAFLATYDVPVPASWEDDATTILSEAYVDTPYLVSMPGVLATVVTLNETAGEGNEGEHVAIVRSTDGGVTWGTSIEVEPASNPSSSWGIPHYDEANDLLYVFYTYNADDVSSVGASSRVDCVGYVAYRTSSDKGLTWSARTVLDVPTTAIDTANITGGAQKLFWLFDVPKFYDGSIYFGLSKITDMSFDETEAFLAKISIPPSAISLLPGGSTGIEALSTFGATDITEEPTTLIHSSDGLITVIARTAVGRLVEAWSTDGGSTFTVDWARYTDGSTYLLNSRGPASAWELSDGRLLLQFYDNVGDGATFASQRNPTWYVLGKRVGNRVRWTAPRKMLLSSSDADRRIGYYSMIELDGELLFAASDKGTAHGGVGAKLIRFPLSDL